MEISDVDLVLRASGGDAGAYAQLINRHAATVYRIVRRMCSDRAEAEAIVQEAFLRAWEHLPRSKIERPFRPWLVQIAVNAARDAWRKTAPLDFADLPADDLSELAEDTAGPEALVEQAEVAHRLAAAVAALPAPYRMVIALRYDAEMAYAEISQVTQLPLNTVRTHLKRAKQQLRCWLEESRV